MTIELQEPRTEALLEQWMSTGHFKNVEDAIGIALQTALSPAIANPQPSGRTGADLFAALRRFPITESATELESVSMPVRDVEL